MLYCHTIVQWHQGACGVMIIIKENGHSNTSSNPGQGWLHLT